MRGKQFFSQRVMGVWKSLPERMAGADTFLTLKKYSDVHCDAKAHMALGQVLENGLRIDGWLFDWWGRDGPKGRFCVIYDWALAPLKNDYFWTLKPTIWVQILVKPCFSLLKPMTGLLKDILFKSLRKWNSEHWNTFSKFHRNHIADDTANVSPGAIASVPEGDCSRIQRAQRQRCQREQGGPPTDVIHSLICPN